MHPTHSSSPGQDSAPPLRMLFWETTASCNLSCSHCRRLDLDATSDELTMDEAKAMFRSAKSLGDPVVVFSGGEPLQRADWKPLADYAHHELGLTIAMATNGTLVDAPTAAAIADAGFRRVSISIDGADAATHDKFRNQVGAFDLALAGTKHLQDVGIPVQFNATVTTHNVDQLDTIYRFAIDHGVVALHLFLLVPVGCGVEIADEQQISAERYEQVLQWVCDRQLENEIELRVTCGPHYYRVAAQRGITPQRGRGCLSGISVVFVSHRGEVFPCGYFPLDCGNVKTTPLDEIWRTNDHFAALRDYDQLEGQCGRCGWKTVCGGCRARAYAATNNYLSEEPFCILTSQKDES